MKKLYYAGVGSRETPRETMILMRKAAHALQEKGYILRSGGAQGADAAFEEGVTHQGMKEIFLPWKGFNGNRSSYTEPTQAAIVMGARYHDALKKLTLDQIGCATGKLRTLLLLMGRNVHQILGPDVEDASKRSSFVLCYTFDGVDGVKRKTTRDTGGTGQAIRIAADHGIKVLNLRNEDIRQRVCNLIGEPV